MVVEKKAKCELSGYIDIEIAFANDKKEIDTNKILNCFESSISDPSFENAEAFADDSKVWAECEEIVATGNTKIIECWGEFSFIGYALYSYEYEAESWDGPAEWTDPIFYDFDPSDFDYKKSEADFKDSVERYVKEEISNCEVRILDFNFSKIHVDSDFT